MEFKFNIGATVITPAAKSVIPYKVAVQSLLRHASGDWGEVSEDDWAINDEALENGGRLLSAYVFNGIRFWIITEHDRSATTILLPDDY